MNKNQWNAFCKFRTEFKEKCIEWGKLSAMLLPLQKEAAQKDTPAYPVENPVVYNTTLDEITENDEIKLIVIGDNPGKNEQLNKNKKYLVGMAGKIADRFFKRNPELQIDFRKNVIILNKTPVHTAKTSHLKYLTKNGGSEIQKLIYDSQLWMAEKTAKLHQDFLSAGTDGSGHTRHPMELWLVGYAELKNHGIFIPYKESIFNAYKNTSTGGLCAAWQKVKVYQHFSMNRFSIDLNDFMKKSKQANLQASLEKLGDIHKNEIFSVF